MVTLTITRRQAAVLVSLLPCTHPGWAETAIDTLATMVRFLGAAASLFTGTTSRVQQLRLADLPQADREAALAQLNELAAALDFLLPRQQIFIGDLVSYLETARSGRFDSPTQRDEVWRAAVSDVDDISEASARVRTAVIRPGTRLQVALSDEDRLTLQSAMHERQALLARLKALAAPTTPGELVQLEQMTQRYARLRQAAFDLRAALQSHLSRPLG